MKNLNKVNPKKRFGQNFLEDQILLDELANLIEIKNHDRFIEIGPGKVLSGLVKRISRDAELIQINNLEDLKKI